MSDIITRSELIALIQETVRVCLREMIEKEKIEEETTTSAIEPLNLPGSRMGAASKKSGWVAGKGGSQRGVAGSASLGYTLTSIGKDDMMRKQDPVY